MFNKAQKMIKEQKPNNSTETAILPMQCYVPLPCPFCGSECDFETTTFGDSMIDYFRVNCKENGHSLDWWVTSKEEAVSVWNCRINGT